MELGSTVAVNPAALNWQAMSCADRSTTDRGSATMPSTNASGSTGPRPATAETPLVRGGHVVGRIGMRVGGALRVRAVLALAAVGLGLGMPPSQAHRNRCHSVVTRFQSVTSSWLPLVQVGRRTDASVLPVLVTNQKS